jgi:hypothetical protein
MAPEQLAVRMGLPLKRASELLQRAMRNYPMPADPEPVEVGAVRKVPVLS